MGTRVVGRWIAVGVLTAGVLTGCSGSSEVSKLPKTSTTLPAKTTTSAGGAGATGGDQVPGKTWTVSKPAAEGMDAAEIEKASDYAFEDGKHTQGMVVVRHGKIVFEQYAPGTDADSWTASWSVAKSFSSALVGQAIAEGKIPSVDEPMTTYFPSWKGTPKEAITLQDVLHMESGLKWNEGYDPKATATSDVVQMGLSADELGYAADRPLGSTPGASSWLYSSGDAMLLSGVIERATGMSEGEYAEKHLFGPLQMERSDWWQDAEGHTLGYCCLDATARAYARFGLLYLNDGKWGDEQVVPASWVHDSVQDAPGDHPGYGNMWWLHDGTGVPKDTYAAQGHDGQFIWVIPSLDLVVVRTGTYVKDPGPSVADPNLFGLYPPDDLIPGKGTIPPDEWDTGTFLAPIVKAVQD